MEINLSLAHNLMIYESREEGHGPSAESSGCWARTNLTDYGIGASEYFERTQNIAGVKVWQPQIQSYKLLIIEQDMRFQALMPDVSKAPSLGLHIRS